MATGSLIDVVQKAVDLTGMADVIVEDGDVYTGYHLEVICRRKEAKKRTLEARMSYNRAVRERENGLGSIR